MAGVSNTSGPIEFGPGFARGVSTAAALRQLSELAGSAEPLHKGRFASATVAILGQLAATDATVSRKLLEGSCAVAKYRGSFVGLEAVFLSALLGAEQDDVRQVVGGVWAAVGWSPVGDVLVPVLDPRVGEVCFLASADLAALTGIATRAQLEELVKNRADAPGTEVDLLAFGAHVLLAASAVASAQQIRALPDSSMFLAPAVRVIPRSDRSEGMPGLLMNGTVALVQVGLIGGTPPTGVTGVWRSIWPTTPTVAPDAPVETPADSGWKASKMCPTWPPSGPGLTALPLIRGTTLVFPKLPRFAPTGELVEPGFYPPLANGGDVAEQAPGRQWRMKSARADPPVGVPELLMDVTGHHADPLTGQLVDVFGRPVPGGGGPGEAAAIRSRLIATARAARLSANTPLSQVVNLAAQVDFGADLLE